MSMQRRYSWNYLARRYFARPAATARLRSGPSIRRTKFATANLCRHVPVNVATAIKNARSQSNKGTAAALRAFAIQRADGRSSHARIFLRCKKFALARDVMLIGAPGRLDDS